MRQALTVLSCIIIMLTTAAAYTGNCGDANGDGSINIGDAVYTINYVFRGGPPPNCGAAIDIDGNVYRTVAIGDQVWMAENLKVTRYRNGDSIPQVTDSTGWIGLTTGAYCNYRNDNGYVGTYGSLYNWYAVNDSRNIAPTGWHVASDAEWQALVTFLGDSTVAGGKLRETGTMHWMAPNAGAGNESGFTGLPGGLCFIDGICYGMTTDGCYWTSTMFDSQQAWCRMLGYSYADVYHFSANKVIGHSVRCVRD